MCYIGKATKIFIFLITVLVITGLVLGFSVLRRTVHPKTHKCSGESCSESDLYPPPPLEFPIPSTPDLNASNPPPPPPPTTSSSSGSGTNPSPPPPAESIASPPSASSTIQTASPPPPPPLSVVKMSPPPPPPVILASPPAFNPPNPVPVTNS